MKANEKNEPSKRSEQEILAEIADLCSSEGYVHALAALCLRDNFVGFDESIKAKDLARMYDWSRLIRTEIQTLTGFMLKQEINWSNPGEEALKFYVSRSDQLMEELHQSLSRQMLPNFERIDDPTYEPFSTGESLREPIFYSGESAYEFQYCDLALTKYVADDEWLRTNKGFSIANACQILKTMESLQNEELPGKIAAASESEVGTRSVLMALTLTVDEIVNRSGVSANEVDAFLTAFTVSENDSNSSFNELNDINLASIKPLIRTPSGEILFLQHYSLAEAVYESPFYWMMADKAYRSIASKNRGEFTEEFSRSRLASVFGRKSVLANINIGKDSSLKGEIDVLVIFGNRAIVLQAKSKRLTIEAKKGNDGQIRDDFKKAIQDSYDQALLCAKALLSGTERLTDNNGTDIKVNTKINEVQIICAVADHYPALSFQARQFLKIEEHDSISPPIVLDVFAIDTLTEMLVSPLYFMSYINRRTHYADKVLASNELVVLALHLKQNLWIEDAVNMLHISDDVSGDLDIAMSVRRRGVRGEGVPPGILTRLYDTTFGGILRQLEDMRDPRTLDLGFLLLQISEDSARDASKALDTISARAKSDNQPHDFSMAFDDGNTGVTFHVNQRDNEEALVRLESHCQLRKYKTRAGSWFGLCLYPNKNVRFGINLRYDWTYDEKIEDFAAKYGKDGSSSIKSELHRLLNTPKLKLGRNDPCSCGSGKKFKKCCLNKT